MRKKGEMQFTTTQIILTVVAIIASLAVAISLSPGFKSFFKALFG